MSRKITQEEAENRIKKYNLTLIDKYKGRTKKAKILCFCGKEFETKPYYIFRGDTKSCGCKNHIPYNKLTQKEAEKRSEKVGIKLIGKYNSGHIKTEFVCPICKKIFLVKPLHVFNKSQKTCGNCKNYRNGVQTSYLALDIHHLIDPNEDFSIHNYQLLDINRNIDIYIPHKKLVIEIDSAHWHKDLLFDEYKHDLIVNAGYNLLVIRTKELRPDIKTLNKKIHEACIYGKSVLVMNDWDFLIKK